MPKIGWQSDLHGKMNLNVYKYTLCVINLQLIDAGFKKNKFLTQYLERNYIKERNK